MRGPKTWRQYMAAAEVCAGALLLHWVLRTDSGGTVEVFPWYGQCQYYYFWPRLGALGAVSYTHLRAHETLRHL
eukprot:6506178-Ditylum_brightwellii.AAC.1